jgi:hypothetical protein
MGNLSNFSSQRFYAGIYPGHGAKFTEKAGEVAGGIETAVCFFDIFLLTNTIKTNIIKAGLGVLPLCGASGFMPA